MFVPLGIGSHVDHQLVFEAGRCLASQGVKVYAYEDCPYAIHTPEGQRTRLAALDGKVGEPVLVPIAETLEQRLEAIACYESQVPVIFRFTHDFRRAVAISHKMSVVSSARPNASGPYHKWASAKSGGLVSRARRPYSLLPIVMRWCLPEPGVSSILGPGHQEEAIMARTILTDNGIPIPDIFKIPDHIRFDLYGKESLQDPDHPGSKIIDHSEHSGRITSVSPALQAVFTNTVTGESLTFNITGAMHTTVEDGITTTKATGHNLLGDLLVPELVLTTGNFTYSFEEGNPTPSPLTGHGHKFALLDLLMPII